MEPGKNRVANQAVYTPDWLADRAVQALDEATDVRRVIEPSMGDGALVRAVRRHESVANECKLRGFSVTHTGDIAETPEELRAPWHHHGRWEDAAWDAALATIPPGFGWSALMNPPWSGGLFARHVQLALQRGARTVVAIGPLAALGHRSLPEPARIEQVIVVRGRAWPNVRECAIYVWCEAPPWRGRSLEWVDAP